MSAQFGRWNFDGEPPAAGYLEKASRMLAPYGPDGGGSYSGPGLDIIYRAFYTTKESRRESQPLQLTSGAVITWDGRLDNREELIGQLGGTVTPDSTDVAIVAAVYERRGTKAFAQLLGDWAVSVWAPKNRELILAKDFLGTRHLYYTSGQQQVTWSTILDPLVLLAGKTFPLEEEYIAGWLSQFPAPHLTPYTGIRAVPPSCFVCLRPGRETVAKYWDFDPQKRIHYATDAAYEEHFRAVFGESVRRRLRSDSPVLAELSGGMDSSSIVCMADEIISRAGAESLSLNTLSYYNDSEPNWNERPYFAKVEEKRGRIGCHIDVGSDDGLNFRFLSDAFAATPGSAIHRSKTRREFATCLTFGKNRVVLSGIGGDEVLGGVPTPTPELADLLSRAQFSALAHKLKLWALDKHKPWFHLLFETVSGFLPQRVLVVPKHIQHAPWVVSRFVKQHRTALQGYEARLKIFGALPSFQENIKALQLLRRQLACSALPSEPAYEIRYPYLDRDLLQFICAIPREQLVGPSHRRDLMRRTLAGIVPAGILQRRRKAFVSRDPLKKLYDDWPSIREMIRDTVSERLGFIDGNRFRGEMEKGFRAKSFMLVTVFRMLSLEVWLKQMDSRNILVGLSSIREPRFNRRAEHKRIVQEVPLSKPFS